MLKTYGAAPYAAALKKLEKQIKEKQTSVNEKIGVKVIHIACASGGANQLMFLLGIGHRPCSSPSLGCRSRQTTNVRRATFTSRTMYKDHPR